MKLATECQSLSSPGFESFFLKLKTGNAALAEYPSTFPSLSICAATAALALMGRREGVQCFRGMADLDEYTAFPSYLRVLIL